MPGNTYVQPVAGEPSLGTPHEHYYVISNGVDLATGTYQIDLSTQVPVGTKRVYVWFWCQYTATGTCSLRNTASTISYAAFSALLGTYGGAQGYVTLDANRCYNFVCNTAITNLNQVMNYYDL